MRDHFAHLRRFCALVLFLALMAYLTIGALAVDDEAAPPESDPVGESTQQRAKAQRAMTHDDRPKVLTSFDWEGSALCEQTSAQITLVMYNVGSTEARDVKVELPEVFGSQTIEFDALAPDAKQVRTVSVDLKNPLTLRARDSSATIKYKSIASSKEYVGKAIPSKDVRILSVEEYDRELSNHYFEWACYLALSLGIGVGVPGYHLYSLN